MLNRRRQLINLLLESNKPITSAQLSTEMNVSSRTIRNDLIEIEFVIQSHCLKLMKKPRIGIWIEGSTKNKDALYLDIKNQVVIDQELYSKENRRNYILLHLLLGKNRSYTTYFADMFYTSTSTIEKDFIHISYWLSQHDLSLQRVENQGIFVKGKEINIRNAFTIVASTIEEEKTYFCDIIHKFAHIELLSIQNMLRKWNTKWNIGLSDVNIKNLVFHIAIMLSRVEKGHGIKYRKNIEMKLFEIKQKVSVNELFLQIEKLVDIELPEGEKDYVLLHLIAMTLDNNTPLSNEALLCKLRNLAQDITDEFLYNLEQIVSLGLLNNLSLKKSLITHLLPTIFRLRYGLNLYNPLLNEIKLNYASAFALASIINASFKSILGMEAGEEEIAYIALHISLVLEKSKEKTTVAVVCPMGRGISRFLLIKLEEKFPELNFLNYSLEDILTKDTSHIDLIVTTTPLEIQKPNILIHAILEEEDISSIRRILKKLTKESKKYFSMQTMMMLHTNYHKNEILKLMSNRLCQYKYVTNHFIEGVLKREEMGSTEIGNGIVLTHGFHDDVKRSQIVFCKLEKPIKWNTQMIQLIVMMAIEKEDSKNVMHMNWLYKTLNNDKALKDIMLCENEKELYQILCNEYNKY